MHTRRLLLDHLSRGMSNAIRHPIFVVAGVGNGTGTGAASARVFAKAGYHVALVARNASNLKRIAEDIRADGGDAAPFPVKAYTQDEMHTTFDAIRKHWPNADVRVALWNATHAVRKTFLDTTPEEVREILDTNVIGAFAFARESILTFKELPIDGVGKRGALLFTGATASLRGNVLTSSFSAAKHGVRALSQSLNKEFGKQNIHVSHVIIDGAILTDLVRSWMQSGEWEKNEDMRLSPESIANSYLYLANQDRSAWTWELDLRPAHEHW